MARVLSLLLLTGCTPAAPPPPNILLISLDTTRADMIGAYGNRAALTPTLDRLASEGVLFDRAYTVTPLTIPAHSSIMTGMWPPRHGVRDNGDFFLGEDAHTLAERMHEAGYATMASVGAEVTSHHWGFAQGFDTFYDDMGVQEDKSSRWRVERTADKVIADARSWFRTRPEDDKRPWFAWVHLFDAHHPYEPPDPYKSIFADRPYLGEIAYTDSQVGSLLGSLRDAGQLDNTWIIITGDHGEGLGSHGEQMHGVLLYDATTHIPFIIRPPAGRAAKTVSTPVSLVDLLPTVLAAAGLAPAEGVDGVSLAALVTGDTTGDPTRTVYAESLYAWHHYGWAQQKALITNESKLIDSTTPEVYLRGDPSERTDVAPDQPALLATLKGTLGALEANMAPGLAQPKAAAQSADRTAQLEALGYLTASATPAADATGLPDPVTHLPSLRRLEDARQALRSGKLDDARAAAEAVVADEPGLGEAKMLLATVLSRQGDLAGAYAIVAALDAEHPGSQSEMMMGVLQLQLHQPEEGIRWLSAALTIDPYLEQGWTAYLRALLVGGNLRRFATEAGRAQALLPDSVPIGGMVGIGLANQGKYAAAEPLLRAAMAAEPGMPLANHALGTSVRALGRIDEAESFFAEEVRLYPPAPSSRRALVEIFADQKRYDEQLAQLNAIAKVEPPKADTSHSIAQVLFNLKRFEEAYAEVKTCEKIDPSYGPCVMLEANALKKLGREQEAQATWRRALAMAGQTPTAP